MCKRPPLWYAILVTAAGAIVTGIGMLATDAQVVDHRYGWWLIVGGCVLVVVALAALFVLGRSDGDEEVTVRREQKPDEGEPKAPDPAIQPMSIAGSGNVVSVGQMGGQTAGVIANIGPQRRTFRTVETAKMISELSALRGTAANIVCLLGDAESFQFATEVKELLEQAGWRAEGISQAVFGGVPQGVVLKCSTPLRRVAAALGDALLARGFRAVGQLDEGLSTLEIIVGVP